MKVWVVESGEYSDYGIDAIFSTRELAEAFVAAEGGESVVEWDLDQWESNKGTWTFEFDLATGNIIEASGKAGLAPASDQAQEATWGKGSPIRIWVDTYDRERAIKIASERFFKIKSFWDDAERMASAADYSPSYSQGFVLAIAKVLAGLEAMPAANGSIHSNAIRKAMGADK